MGGEQREEADDGDSDETRPRRHAPDGRLERAVSGEEQAGATEDDPGGLLQADEDAEGVPCRVGENVQRLA